MSQSVFKVNSPKVIFEAFDDEVVLINLDNGNYYSMGESGLYIWRLIEQGAAISEILCWTAERFSESSSTIERAVNQFVQELLNEELIVLDASVAPNKSIDPNPNGSMLAPGTNNFRVPVLHKYTDMQDLLLLDPIHEVDEMGWPVVKPDSSTD